MADFHKSLDIIFLKNMAKENPKGPEPTFSSKSSNTFLNILIIGLIVVVFYWNQHIMEQIDSLEQEI